MKLNRRKFIRNSGLLLAGARLANSSMLPGKRPGELTGVQLYSVREDMKKNPLETLKQVAAMGYKHVEHANYVDRKFYGYTAKIGRAHV